MRALSATAWLAVSLALSAPVAGDVVYDLEGPCSDGCAGTATGELRLTDDYTPGAGLSNANFVSFHYQSSSGSILLTDIGALLNLGGSLPVNSGVRRVEIDFTGSDTGLNTCAAATDPPQWNTCTVNGSGWWEMLWFPEGISDRGTSHTWTLRPAEPVEVDVEIQSPRGGRCRNRRSVEIYGAADFDVTAIDTSTLVFGEDGPDGYAPQCALDYLNDDEHLDLACRFVPGTALATLSGELVDGSTFTGSDTICAAD